MIDVAPHDRPREKLEKNGAGALGDNELLAVLVGHGTAGTGALELANEILSLAGSTHGLTRLHLAQLLRISGVGRAQASRVLAAVELGRRTVLMPVNERPRFRSPLDIARYLLPQYGSFPVERFGLVMLDTRYRLVSTRLTSVGSLDSSVAHPREIFREALLANASAVVVFHNHPSGDVTPSRDDLDLTLRLKKAGEIVGIDLADHIILADTKYCSMKESRFF